MFFLAKYPLRLSFYLVFCLYGCTEVQHTDSDSRDRFPNIEVPEGYEVDIVAGPNLLDYPMFATLDETGRLFVFESIGNVYQTSQQAIDTPQFRIALLEDLDGDGSYDKRTTFADSLSFPQGGVFYQGSLYASSAPDLLKLTDTDGDGIADEREVILSGWILNVNANSLVGPFMGPDGWLYMTNAIMGFDVTSKEGQQMKGETARIWRVRPDGTDLEWISAGGMNNPVELTFTPAAEVIGTQTFFVDPQRGLRDALTFWVEGGIYGKKNSNITRDGLVRTGELMPVVTHYSRAAPAGVGSYRNTALGDGFQDNLFSAQFNTHRVIRHKLFREGGSFRTEDEIFLSSEHEDFHPTDVLEAADGSLLVVETGGWFILGCPLSQVSKPQLQGSIYRIRRTDAAPVADPYGKDMDWESMSIADIAGLWKDLRPFVVDRAVEALIEQGVEAVPMITSILQDGNSEHVRTRAVFALYRIGLPDAHAAIRTALTDSHEQVRIAAARTLGMAKDQEAVDALIRHLQDESLAVRRQAATALRQIGNVDAIDPLLSAIAGTEDRFVQHAILYALISFEQPQRIAAGLKHPSPGVRQAALIVLDQSQHSPLKADHLTSFLASPDPKLQETALWVASHHPEWAGAMTNYLDRRLTSARVRTDGAALLHEILVSFCGDPRIQQFIRGKFAGGDPELKRFLLASMSACQEANFPEIWTNALRAELEKGKNPDVKSGIVELIRLRRIDTLRPMLEQVTANEAHPPLLRMQAIGALLSGQAEISDAHFKFVFQQLKTAEAASLRRQAAITLADARLSTHQLTQIASEYLPSADPFILPRLVPMFRGPHELKTGQALADVLLGAPGLDNFTEDQLRLVFAEYPAEIQPAVEQVITKLNTARSERLDRIRHAEAQISKGDEGRGRALYFGKATCWTCHTIGTEGGDLGPDLTSIQKDRSPHDILEAILYPSVSFVREFETYKITTASQTYTGIIQEQSPQALVLGVGPAASVRIQRSEITEIKPSDLSLMPQGLGELLTEAELADLMSFLLGNDLIY